MIAADELFSSLRTHGVDFFAGVPDSLLKDFCAYVTDHAGENDHIICANEGAAIAAATGHYLATRHPGLVYMQNSGFGNSVNPLLSLADPEVYSIPMLLLIGWRGEPGKKDEPQHKQQGKVMVGMMEAMRLPYRIIDDTTADLGAIVGELAAEMTRGSRPVALVAKAGTFAPYTLQKKISTSFELGREAALGIILDSLGGNDIVVGTTGMLSREIFEYRERHGQDHGRDFLTVGSMGHSSQIALGIALAKRDRQVFCLDGDGAALMHLGSLAIIGTRAPSNFKHVVVNNGAHDSVGGQPTAGFSVNLCDIARACRYKNATRAETADAVHSAIRSLRDAPGPAMLEILVNKGARKDLGRPTTTPAQNRDQFMKFIG